MQSPILYLPHGGGPLPLLDDPRHAALIDFLAQTPREFTPPRAILVISAHWEAQRPTLSASAAPDMIYDYSGFPPQSYEFRYPAPGSTELAGRVAALLEAHGIEAALDHERGFDHGTFVPLMLMYPRADIPVVQLSLIDSLDPAAHIELGQAIAELAQQGVLIVGSGMSFHNMTGFMSGKQDVLTRSATFDRWLNEVVVGPAGAGLDPSDALRAWRAAPEARYCHPREEHLLPLHVCCGAAQQLGRGASNVFDQELLGVKVSAFMWQ